MSQLQSGVLKIGTKVVPSRRGLTPLQIKMQAEAEKMKVNGKKGFAKEHYNWRFHQAKEEYLKMVEGKMEVDEYWRRMTE